MSDDRLPKIICYSELQQGTRFCGGQRKRFKDCLKANLKKCDIEPNELEDLAQTGQGGVHSAKTQYNTFFPVSGNEEKSAKVQIDP